MAPILADMYQAYEEVGCMLDFFFFTQHVVRLRPKGTVEQGRTCPQAEVVARVLGGHAEGEFS
jgi:hypothetical protein